MIAFPSREVTDLTVLKQVHNMYMKMEFISIQHLRDFKSECAFDCGCK
jgi:hypothetical protein